MRDLSVHCLENVLFAYILLLVSFERHTSNSIQSSRFIHARIQNNHHFSFSVCLPDVSRSLLN